MPASQEGTDMAISRRKFLEVARRPTWPASMLTVGAWLMAVVACCGSTFGQTSFVANLHTAHGAHNHFMAGGQAVLTLNAEQTELSYRIELQGLDLEPRSAERVDAEDVFGIHLHLIVPGQIGPHILNIFGDPAEEDGDLIVDYSQERLWGVFDVADATRDPATGELLPQFFPLTTKVIGDWIDELMVDGLYLAVHTVGQNGAALLHGDVIRVPEPPALVIAAVAAAILACFLHRRELRLAIGVMQR
jgi:hypothetical protein